MMHIRPFDAAYAEKVISPVAVFPCFGATDAEGDRLVAEAFAHINWGTTPLQNGLAPVWSYLAGSGRSKSCAGAGENLRGCPHGKINRTIAVGFAHLEQPRWAGENRDESTKRGFSRSRIH
jgi:hypothetical protein